MDLNYSQKILQSYKCLSFYIFKIICMAVLPHLVSEYFNDSIYLSTWVTYLCRVSVLGRGLLSLFYTEWWELITRVFSLFGHVAWQNVFAIALSCHITHFMSTQWCLPCWVIDSVRISLRIVLVCMISNHY